MSVIHNLNLGYKKFLHILRQKQCFAHLLLVAAIVLVYANVIQGGFVYDDKNFIRDNRPIKEWLFSHPWDFFLKPEVAVWSGIYRPLRTLSFSIDYQFFGLNPMGYNCENILLHTINTLLVFSILSVILACRRKAFLAALLFAVHPVQLEAVSWISSRGDLLFALFVLICWRWYISWRDDDRVSWTQLIGWLFMYVMGLLSKETAIALFPTILTYDILVVGLSQKRGVYNILKKRKKIYFSMLVVSVLYLIVRFNIFESVSQKPYWGGSVQSNMLTMFEATLYYFKLIFYPTNLALDYSTYPIIYSFADVRLILPAIFYLAATILCGYSFMRKNYLFLFFIALSAFFLLPSWNIIPISAIIAERFLYVSMVGMSAVFACVLDAVCCGIPRRRIYGILTLIFVIVCLMVLSVNRNKDWYSDLTIWKACVDVFPGNYKGHINLGTQYEAQGEHIKAISENIKLISVKPNHATAYYNLGNIYWHLGLFEKSRSSYLTALHYKPDYWQAMNNLASLYVDKMWYHKAEHVLLQLIVKNPDYAKAHFNLGLLYLNMLKKYPEAKYHLKKSMEDREFRDSSKVRSMLQQAEELERKTSQKEND